MKCWRRPKGSLLIYLVLEHQTLRSSLQSSSFSFLFFNTFAYPDAPFASHSFCFWHLADVVYQVYNNWVCWIFLIHRSSSRALLLDAAVNGHIGRYQFYLTHFYVLVSVFLGHHTVHEVCYDHRTSWISTDLLEERRKITGKIFWQ